MSALLAGQDPSYAYLTAVLGILCEITVSSDATTFNSIVKPVRAGIYRIRLDGGCTLIVDANLRVVDDPEFALPEGFPGRLPITRRYRLTWQDEDRVPTQVVIKAASRRFARLFSGAPENAYVERV